MNDYFDGAVKQFLRRGEILLEKIPSGLSTEFNLLEQICRTKLTEVIKGLHALTENPEMQKPEFQKLRLREYRRLVEALDVLETTVVPALARAHQSDDFLYRLVQQIRSEINYPLLPPAVSPFSQNYFYIVEDFRLICVPFCEGHFLLHLPDIYHELAHPLIWEKEKGYPVIKPYQISLIESLDEVRSWVDEELENLARGRQPDDYEFYFRQWKKSWENWCKELYCDLFATFTLGPAFAWSHFHLCAARGGNPFEVPLFSVTTHPADDARMEAILDGLSMIGFKREAARIEEKWKQFNQASGFSQEPEYQMCFPRRILRLLSEKALAGVKAMKCRIASERTSAPVHNALNQAWDEFWRNPNGYLFQEKRILEELRKQFGLK